MKNRSTIGKYSVISVASTLALSAVLISGCPGPGDLIFDECLEVIEIDRGIFRVTEKEEQNSSSTFDSASSTDLNIGQTIQELNVKYNSIWKKTRIPVCWETWDTDAESVTMREDTREMIELTWNDALNDPRIPEADRVRFVGWGRCEGLNGGIRIVVEDGDSDNGPHVKALGDGLKNRFKGMSLNFKFSEWSPSCGLTFATRRWCNRLIAVHEFGHALGLAHEHNRIDTDRETCTDAPQGSNGDIYYGRWDPDSTMNYCNNRWNNWGVLSAGDRMWIKAVYYPELVAHSWCAEAAHQLRDDAEFHELGSTERMERIRELLIDLHQAETLATGGEGY